MISLGLSPKEDVTNSIAQSAMDLQDVEAERPNIHGMVGHVINLLHHSKAKRDENEKLLQSSKEALNDHAKCKKNSTIQSQWAGKQLVKAIQNDCENPRRRPRQI